MFLVIIVLFFSQKIAYVHPQFRFFLLCGACVRGVLLIGR